MTCRDEVLDAIRVIRDHREAEIFTVQEVIDEMRQRGTSYEESTIRTHITSRMCANAPDHHAVVYPDIERVGEGEYRLTGSV